MATRYRRVNIDGQSLYKTETRTVSEDLTNGILPGTFAVIDADDQWAQAAGVTGRLYIIDAGYHEGLGITDAIPADHSAVGNYVEEGREFAVRMGPGTYTKDQPITVNASGQAIAVPTTAGTYQIIGYSQDDATIASGATDFIRIRIRASSVTVA